MVKFFEENGRFLKGGEAVAVRVVALSNSGLAVEIVGTTGLFYIHGDHLGSSTALTDPSGGLVDDIVRYAPFGEVRGGALPTNITDRGFTGHKHNAEIGLIYMNARFYDPYINRFLSADTIVPDPANPQQFNRYTYSLGNPVKFVDPSGHCVETYQDDDELMTQCFEVWNAIGTHFSGIVPGRDEYPQEYMHSLMMNANIDQLVRIYQGMGYERFDHLVKSSTSLPMKSMSAEAEFLSQLLDFDAGGVGISGNVDLPVFLGGRSGVGGLELVYNWESKEITLFGIYGSGATAGAGANLGAYGTIINNAPNNATYSGSVIGIDGTGSIGPYGAVAGRATSASEILRIVPDGAHSYYAGYAPGANVSLTANYVNYVPVLTVRTDHRFEPFVWGTGN